jgi:signal transduction histidine kinase
MDAIAAAWDRLARMDQRWVDGAIAVALTVLTQIQVAGAGGAGRAALLLTLALAFRRVAPLAVALVVAVAAALQGLAAEPPSALGEYLSITLAVYTVAALCPLGPAIAGGVAIAVGIVLHDIDSSQYGSVAGMLSDLSTPALFWAVGRAVRLSRARAARAHEEARAAELAGRTLAVQAVADERRHMARELHDVVTHSLGIVVLQAEAARRFVDDREPEVAGALDAIETAGRTAMDEMRRLLGLLREGGEAASRVPPPTLAQLPELISRVGASGLAVELRSDDGASPLPAGVELSAYRIVQEALTNTLRHAHAANARVVVVRDESGLSIEVTDDGAAHVSGRPGRGLHGMQERVALFGGTLEHGPRERGGYRVAAWLPVRANGRP